MATARGRQDVATLSAPEVEAKFVGQAPEDRHVSGLVSFVGDPDLKFRERDVLNPHPRKGTDAASGFKKRPDEQTLGTTSSVGGVEEGFKLVFG